MRNRATRRKNDLKKAIRKKKIADEIYFYEDSEVGYYDNLHQYSKNKIHCSCKLCCNKTNNKTKRNVTGNYSPSYNPSLRDKKQLEKLDYNDED